jgi:hypothetical protein
MPVVDVAMVSSSSNIFSIRSIMLLVVQEIVEVETLYIPSPAQYVLILSKR